MGAPLRIGVIGRGFGARVVAPVFAAIDGCEVVDVVSPCEPLLVAELCARGDVDLVSIHSPPFLHREHVERALDAGHAVLCDKPFGRNAAEAEAMTRAAEDAGVVHLVNFEFRFDPARRRLCEIVRAGRLGRVEHVHWTAWSSGSRVPLRPYGWLFDRALGGGWVGAWGSHAVDYLRTVFGEIVTVSARCRTVIPERPDPDGKLHRCTAEDSFTASLSTDTGTTITIDTSFAAPANLASRLVVVGSTGVLEDVGDRRLTIRDERGAREEIELDAPEGDLHLAPMRTWAHVVRDVVQAGTVLPGVPTFRDGLACARVLDRLRVEPDARPTTTR